METINFIKSIKLRDKILLAGVFLAVIISAVIFLTKDNQKQNVIPAVTLQTETSTKNNVLKEDGVYLGKIEDICPYYQPNGIAYKHCLSDLIDQQEIILNHQFNKLITDLKDTKTKRESLDYFASIGEYDDVIEDVKNYESVWKPYRDAFCYLDNMDSLSGSGYSGFVMTCRLEEIQKFSMRLSEIDRDYNWIPEE